MKQQQRQASITVFFSYAQADQTIREQLALHLSQLKRSGLIEEWSDQQILAVADRAQEVDWAIRSAQIILLLISADFLASDACYRIEMQQALERHRAGVTRVIPIITRPCDWQHSPFAHLQCLPRNTKPITAWNNQDEAFAAIAQELRKIVTQQQLPSPPLSHIQRLNRARLLKRVRATWIDGLLAQSFHHAARIELYLQDRPDMLTNPWRRQVQELEQAPKTLPSGTTIVQVYDEADGELLILGEPGAGKTTLLLELARTLLERAEKNERLPMPTVFHLSSWAEKRQPLRTWLVEELRTKYQVPHKIGQAWLDTDQMLLLLDGLDEVPKEAQSACVEQINHHYRAQLERGSSAIVVCCRSEEYAALTNRLLLQQAVGILPLTDEQIKACLEQAGEQVRGLRQALDGDIELHSLARQLLLLTIFMLTYQGAQASEIRTRATREEIQQAIFVRYVERMMQRRGQPKSWRTEQGIRWLTFLAVQMQRHAQTIFSVENVQLTWLSGRWRTLYRWCAGLPVGLAGGLLIVLMDGLAGAMDVVLVDGLIFVLLAWLIFGLGVKPKINPAEAITWSWKNAGYGLLAGLLGGLGGGLLGGLGVIPIGLLVSGPLSGLGGGLLVGLLGGLIFGLVLGTAFGLSGRQIPERLSLSPNEGIWRSGKNGLLIGSGVCLAIVLIFTLLNLQTHAPLGELVGTLPFGLLLGLLGGLAGGLLSWQNHFLLRIFLSCRSDFPWELVPFLDQVAERLLLRKVGGNYIFVHRLLLEYFASLGNEQAIHGYDHAIRLGINNKSAYYERGLACVYQKQYEQAIADLTQAIKLDARNFRIYLARGFAYLHLKRYEQAIADLTQVIKLNTKVADAYLFRGYSYLWIKNVIWHALILNSLEH